MTLLIWCVSYLELDKGNGDSLEKTFISNVQAEATPVVLGRVIHKDTILQVVPSFTPHYPDSLQLAASSAEKKSQQQITLRFQSKGIQLDNSERVRLEKMLQELKMNSSYSTQILAGPIRSENNAAENNVSSLQIVKLRAQSIARTISPYTQSIKMIYRPSLDEGTMVVEIFLPFASKNTQ
ncbi:MAG: hypothetical protein BWK79_10155 [Beggiatoa sp. IS2]|nr:MAG: hypothetical protein BWK79_10155 [Beggiatoa sp. IS2]